MAFYYSKICNYKCLQVKGATRNHKQAGPLGTHSKRCNNCNVYFPITAKITNKKGLERCPCCNYHIRRRPRAGMSRTRREELERNGIIKRI